LVISISFIFCLAKPTPWLSLPINSGLQTDTYYVGYCLTLTPTHCSELVSVGMVDMIAGNYHVTVAVAIEHACYCWCCSNDWLTLSVFFRAGDFSFPVHWNIYVVGSVVLIDMELYPHKLVVAWMRVLLTFPISWELCTVSLLESSHCFWECNRNSWHRCSDNGLPKVFFSIIICLLTWIVVKSVNSHLASAVYDEGDGLTICEQLS
jgi:hypothetical protein